MSETISVYFNDREQQRELEPFNEFFEQRAEDRGENYSQSAEIKQAMHVYRKLIEQYDSLGYDIEHVQPQWHQLQRALLDIHRRDGGADPVEV